MLSQSNTSIDKQSTSNDRLKPILTADPVNMSMDRLFANLGLSNCKRCSKDSKQTNMYVISLYSVFQIKDIIELCISALFFRKCLLKKIGCKITYAIPDTCINVRAVEIPCPTHPTIGHISFRTS